MGYYYVIINDKTYCCICCYRYCRFLLQLMLVPLLILPLPPLLHIDVYLFIVFFLPYFYHNHHTGVPGSHAPKKMSGCLERCCGRCGRGAWTAHDRAWEGWHGPLTLPWPPLLAPVTRRYHPSPPSPTPPIPFPRYPFSLSSLCLFPFSSRYDA